MIKQLPPWLISSIIWFVYGWWFFGWIAWGVGLALVVSWRIISRVYVLHYRKKRELIRDLARYDLDPAIVKELDDSIKSH